MSNNIMLESSPETDKKEVVSDPRSLVRQDSKSRWESGWMFPRRWMLPALNTDFPTSMELFKTKDSEVIRVKEDESKLEDVLQEVLPPSQRRGRPGGLQPLLGRSVGGDGPQ